jgi:hypothetical protein
MGGAISGTTTVLCRCFRGKFPLMVLIVLYTALWVPHVFIINDNLSLIAAYDIDSETAMEAVINALDTYNLNDSYISRIYGWTFYFIAYILLKPILLVGHISTAGNPVFVFIAVRALVFLIGLASLVILYTVLEKMFSNRTLSFAGCLSYAIPMFWSNMFIVVHPETTGILFLLLSILVYFRMRESKYIQAVNTLYIIGVACLALSALSKQFFFFTAMPVFFMFNLEQARVRKEKALAYFISVQFILLLLISLCIGILTLMIIHPYVVIEYEKTIASQLYIMNEHTTEGLALDLGHAWRKWLSAVSENVFIVLMLALSAVNLVFRVTKQRRDTLSIVCSISSLALTAIVFTSYRRFVGATYYLMPIYPFYIISAISFVTLLRQSSKLAARIAIPIIGIVFAISLIMYGRDDIAESLTRLNYKTTMQYRLYEYIKEEIPEGSKLAISHLVIIAAEKQFKVFHWWSSDLNKLGEFDPDYLIYLPQSGLNGKLSKEAISYTDYARSKGYKEIFAVGDLVVLKRP